MNLSTRTAGIAATATIFLLVVFKISLTLAIASVSGHPYDTAMNEPKIRECLIHAFELFQRN